MTKKNALSNQIKFKYIFSDDYNPTYANGVFGGITTKREIVLNFFLERHGLPVTQSHYITENGELGEEIETNPKDFRESMIRFIESGVVLNLESAKAIYGWLGDKIEKLDNMQSNKRNSGNGRKRTNKK